MTTTFADYAAAAEARKDIAAAVLGHTYALREPCAEWRGCQDRRGQRVDDEAYRPG